MEQTFSLNGMHCQSCVKKIEQSLAPFATSIHADIASASLKVSNLTISVSELQNRVHELGAYELGISAGEMAEAFNIKAYYPLGLIVVYLSVVSATNAQSASEWMRHFMAAFFLTFSFFKLLSVKKFADGYTKYDLLASRWKTYGSIYPFLELALGLAYLFNSQLRVVLWITIGLMSFSSLGVLHSVRRREQIRCACLGDFLNVPLSVVTLIEDFGMAAMAIVMLVMD